MIKSDENYDSQDAAVLSPFLPSDLKENSNSLFDSPQRFEFAAYERLDVAYEETQLRNNSMSFNFDLEQGDELKYQIDSDDKTSTPTVLNKKIGKLDKINKETQAPFNQRGKKHYVPSISVPKNVFPLGTGYAVTMVEKAVYEEAEKNAIKEVISCVGQDTIATLSESLLQSAKNFRKDPIRSRKLVKAFMSLDQNAGLIKEVFSRTFTPGSALLKNYLLTTKMEEPNRNALQNPLILEELRKKMDDNH